MANIFSINAGRPLDEYPSKLEIFPGLVSDLRQLQKDNEFEGYDASIERCGIIIQAGKSYNLHALSKTKHVNYFLENPSSYRDATGSSPPVEYRLGELSSRGIDVNNAEIGVHTHPWFTPPSLSDLIIQSSNTKSSDVFKKKIVVNKDKLFFLVPSTKTASMLKAKGAKLLEEEMRSRQNAHRTDFSKPGAGKEHLKTMRKQLLSVADYAGIVVYELIGDGAVLTKITQ